MNLVFLHPDLLALPPLVAVAGWFLLRNTRSAVYSFTILDFWPAETINPAGRHKSKPDWPWVLILLAAVLATMALASPRLQITGSKTILPPEVTFQAAGRSLPGNSQAVDLFIRAPEVNGTSDYTVTVTTPRQKFKRNVSARKLRGGIDISPVMATRRINLTLQHANRILARTVLRRLSGTNTIAAHFIGSPPSAFLRLFAALPDVTLHGQLPDRAVWIIHQSQFNPAIMHSFSNSTFILLGDTPGPGLSPTSEFAVTNTSSLSVVTHNSLMHAVHPKGVIVRKIVTARRDSHWHTLIECNGHAWLAERNDPATRQTWLWLAGQINSTWSTWQDHASFVIFFANVIANLQKWPGPATQSDSWLPSAVHAPRTHPLLKPTAKTRSIHLNIGLALLGCALLITAASTLAWRARTIRINAGVATNLGISRQRK